MPGGTVDIIVETSAIDDADLVLRDDLTLAERVSENGRTRFTVRAPADAASATPYPARYDALGGNGPAAIRI